MDGDGGGGGGEGEDGDGEGGLRGAPSNLLTTSLKVLSSVSFAIPTAFHLTSPLCTI